MVLRITSVFFVLIIASSIITSSEYTAGAQTLSPEERASLQAQYDELQREIEEQQKIIDQTKAQKNTLQGDVTLLNAKIKAAQAQIDAKNITIRQLSVQIQKKAADISQLENRIERGKEALASILRQTQIIDDYSVVSVALGAHSVSEFFKDLDAFSSIKTDLQTQFKEIRDAKEKTESALKMNFRTSLIIIRNQLLKTKKKLGLRGTLSANKILFRSVSFQWSTSNSFPFQSRVKSSRATPIDLS